MTYTAPPPQPPAKSRWKIWVGLGCGIPAVLFIGLIFLGAVVGPQDDPKDKTSAAPSASNSPTKDQDDKPTELTPEERESIRADAGLPPTPAPAEWKAYIAGLKAVDPDIVHGKEDKAVSRGINQCSSIHRYPDNRDAQVQHAMSRFTSPTHPEGRTRPVAEQIVDLAHKHICPSY